MANIRLLSRLRFNIQSNSQIFLNRTCQNTKLIQSKEFSIQTDRFHENPLGLPKRKFAEPETAGIPRTGSPPSLKNISRSIPSKRRIANVKKVLVVASGKGGVGKSTVSANLAMALGRRSSMKIGLLDLDIFGPSVPKIMGLEGGLQPELTSENAIVPMCNHGIACMSIGFLLPSTGSGETPVAWRGMMVMKAVQQLLFDVDWRAAHPTEPNSELDILVIDMPPGTGDVALSLGQLVEVDGALIVSTPQDIALIDVSRGVSMFEKVNIPILGTILNMSHFVCTECKTSHSIFGSATHFEKLSKKIGVKVLGEIPLEYKICESGDAGKPIVGLNDPFGSIAEKCIKALEL
ncbi:hypothetical protein CROQUDRAFT_719213 [Cronartium quercuum f. sp. fusiforme G11]|uniref:Uncharacterized protein n=1 Tax=Cronartium quercuum f. sp. fusiforme G11 TaxID=708437 RepID=A0A9P6NZS0_9BASI|nr:hypothetical protein CROQUDRAFT_719213 [Cronartium quercuum f. sp. fusiforme G11]